jgi:hypothetical protein
VPSDRVKKSPGVAVFADRIRWAEKDLTASQVGEHDTLPVDHSSVDDVVHRERLVPRLRVEVEGRADLPDVAQATGRIRPLANADEGWEKESCQNGDDRDGHEELDQGEGARPSHGTDPLKPPTVEADGDRSVEPIAVTSRSLIATSR